MKTRYLVRRDDLVPPIKNVELAAFALALQSSAVRDALTGLNTDIPEEFSVCHNTGVDDPPDIEALGLRWEHTYFPPNQVPLEKVHQSFSDSGGRIMTVPPFSETGADIRKIRELSHEASIEFPPKMYAVDD